MYKFVQKISTLITVLYGPFSAHEVATGIREHARLHPNEAPADRHKRLGSV